MRFPVELESITVLALKGKGLHPSDAKELAEGLLLLTGHAVKKCKQCKGAFITIKPNQSYCCRQCNWDFWNARKMVAYYKRKKVRA